MNPLSITFNTKDLTSIRNLYLVLGHIRGKQFIDVRQIKEAKIGPQGWEYIHNLQKQADMPVEKQLQPEFITYLNRLAFKMEESDGLDLVRTLQGWLIQLGHHIDPEEQERGGYGETTQQAIQQFQEKNGLSPDGFNAETLAVLRNTIGQHDQQDAPANKEQEYSPALIQQIQAWLKILGYAIDPAEQTASQFGPTTQQALLEFQKVNGMEPTGQADESTIAALKEMASQHNNAAGGGEGYLVKGGVKITDEQGIEGAQIEIFEVGFRGQTTLLATGYTNKEGHYALSYAPPLNPSTEAPKETFHIYVQATIEENSIKSQTFYRVEQEMVVDFILTAVSSQPLSVFERTLAPILEVLGEVRILDVQESDTHQDVSFLHQETGTIRDDIIKLLLAHHIADALEEYALLNAAWVYGVLYKEQLHDLPTNWLPNDLSQWQEWLNTLVKRVTETILSTKPETIEGILKQAIEAQFVPMDTARDYQKSLEQLEAARSQYKFQQPLIASKIALKEVFSLANISQEVQQTLVKTFDPSLALHGDVIQLLSNNPVLKKEEVEALEQTQILASLADHDLSLMQALHTTIQTNSKKEADPKRLSDFAKWTQDHWKQFIQKENIPIPDTIPANDEEAALDAYAKVVYQKTVATFPVVALVAQSTTNDQHQLKTLSRIGTFLDQQPSFDLQKDQVDVFRKEHPQQLTEEMAAELKVLKRINNIAPSPEAGVALLSQRIYSASQVYAMGKTQLTKKLSGSGLSASLIEQTYNRAKKQYVKTVSLVSQYHFSQQNPKAIISLTGMVNDGAHPVSSQIAGLPDLETLFGSLDYCACQHCKSVYSPAAYLTDLLRFLDRKTVKSILLQRRPDIDDIGLNCENAHKPLPYIDLVCEVLENALEHPPTVASNANFAHNTTLSAEELKAFPQYTRSVAYEILAQQFPIHQHLNLWLAEAHLFLEHLGVPYHELMQTWQQANVPNDVAIAAAYFEIYSHEIPLITSGTSLPIADIFPRDGAGKISVSLFLERSKLTYDQLIELLQLEFLNPTSALTVIERPVDSCALADQYLAHHLTDDKLRRIYRFLSFIKHTDWALWELDLLIRNKKVGNGHLNGTTLINLQKFHQLQQRLGLSVEALIAFYEPLNTIPRRDALNKPILPLYSRLFLNPAIDHPNVANFEVANVSSNSGGINASDSSTIAAVLGVEETMIAYMFSQSLSYPTDLEVLSQIYRVAVLSKKLGWSIKEYYRFIRVGPGNAFGDLDRTMAFLDKKQALDTAGIATQEITYLLRSEPSDLDLTDAQIEGFLEGQRTAMLALNNELFNTAEPIRDLLHRHLGKLPVFDGAGNKLEQALDLVLSEGQYKPTVTLVAAVGNPLSFSKKHALFVTFTTHYFGFVRDINDAINILDYNNGSSTEQAAKIRYVLEELEYYLGNPLIQNTITNNMGVAPDVMQTLLALTNQAGTPLLTVFRQLDLIATPLPSIDYTNYAAQFDAYRLLHKMVFLVKKWQLTGAELAGYTRHYTTAGVNILHLNVLPIPNHYPQVVLPYMLEQLINWSRFVRLDRQYTKQEGSMAQLWDQTTTSELLDKLAAWTNWDRDQLEEIAVNHGLALSLSDFYNIDTYVLLESRLEQLQTLGVQVSRIQTWIQRDAGLPQQQAIANQIKKAVKATYTEEAWLKALQPIQNTLRTKKRDALVAFFLEYQQNFGQNWENANDLFQYYLIDVEMSTCQMTSRIKQAISSVQLFVQRALMNLEPDITIQNPDTNQQDNWAQWKWMKNYRIWEANRKVFLYPENWIEPELRDDKSSFFKELENDLLQQEITHEHVEAAFARYLHKVDSVAHVDVMGICDGGPNNEGVQYVLARTKETPGTYYFRTYDGIWSPWEAIEVAITGEHALPAVFNGKVYIFWLEMLEKPTKAKKNPANRLSATPQDAPENIPLLEIKLAWTVRKSDGWTPKKVSNKKLLHPWPRPDFSFHLRPRQWTKTGSGDPSLSIPDATEFWLDLFVSSSREFNNKAFYNEYTGGFERLANSSFSENHRPWHSSSFVFDGGRVIDVQLRSLAGKYYLPKEIIEHPKVASQGPLKINYVHFHHGLSIYVSTNYRPFYYDYTDSTQKANELNALNQKIKDTRAVHLPIVEIEDIEIKFIGLYTYKIIIKTNRGDYNLTSHANLQPLNNLIATGSTDHALGSTTSNTSTKDTTDSYTFVQNSFGADGRALTPLLEGKTGDFARWDDLKYAFNYRTNRTDNQAMLPLIGLGYPLLGAAIAPFKVIVSMKDAIVPAPYHPYFYQDEKRAFFIEADWAKTMMQQFYPFYHPYTDMFITQLNKYGVDGLLKRTVQLHPERYQNTGYDFAEYHPDGIITKIDSDYETDCIDFDKKGPYAGYNWEIFFHIPLMIATQLSKNQRFEEALQWFHYIFDPTNTEPGTSHSTPQKYWITKPFHQFNDSDYQQQAIERLLKDVSKVEDQIIAWKNNPFKPHLVARHRQVAYQRNVVMKYLDNLIAWGDQLFRRETLESINQATLLYVLAHELLGDRPVEMAALPVDTKTYAELEASTGGVDYFGNADVLVAVEGLLTSADETDDGAISDEIPVLTTQYFCIPNNEKLLAYWDIVEDRLFKIRHCMNIDGNVRQLPLFAPPIDPALLVKATAAGLDIGTVLDDLSTPRSNYKYRVLSGTASQFCTEVKSLGQSLLSALQSKDAEGMALLQSTNTIKVLDATLQLKALQVEEAKESIASLEISKASATLRKTFYEGREFMNAGETAAMALSGTSIGIHFVGTVLESISSILAAIPDFTTGGAGMGGSPAALVKIGGTNLSGALRIASNMSYQTSNVMDKIAGLVGQSASYQRRQEEWDFQAELATKDIEQIEQQIVAAEVRLALAEKDLQTHQLQIDNAKAERAYLQSKYTNQQLYSWMVSQISTVYFQAYQLAYDMAKRAEKSFKYELALPHDSMDYIKFGYWDSLKKGLLAGDKLMLAINKMEAAYLEQNKRELELTKHISLQRLAPTALVALITTGECTIEVPEWWFDLDFAGHYMRRLKGISVSMPCIVGPYTNINATLTLEKHQVRPTATAAVPYDSHLAPAQYTSESIAISQGQNDSGLFEFNFNDERYLPFEGVGVISRWKLKLAHQDLAQFDYTSITDVVLHMRYTARDGGALLAKNARNAAKARINTSLEQLEQPALVLSLKQQFATAWHQMFYPHPSSTDHAITFQLEEKHFPYITKFGSSRTIQNIYVYGLHPNGDAVSIKLNATVGGGTPKSLDVTTNHPTGAKATLSSSDLSDVWKFELDKIDGTTPVTTALLEQHLDDLMVVLEYTVEIPQES